MDSRFRGNDKRRVIFRRALVRASLASCFLLLASSGLLLCRAAERGSFQPRIRILDFVQVEGETIKLSDLLPPGAPAELGELGDRIILGNSPLPASQRVISRDQIELQLRDFPSVLGQLELPERLVISCKQRRLSPEEIWKAIETFLAAEGVGGPLTARPNAISLQAPVFVTKQDPGLEVKRMEPDRVRRQIRFLLWTSNEPQVLPFYVTVEELSRRAAWQTSDHGAAGPEPDSEDTQGGREEALTDIPDLLSGTLPRVSLHKSGSAPKAMSPPPVLVAKGKPAKLVVETATLRLTALVTPLESGVKGQIIRVRNLDTQRVFEAEVLGAGLLQADLAGE